MYIKHTYILPLFGNLEMNELILIGMNSIEKIILDTNTGN